MDTSAQIPKVASKHECEPVTAQGVTVTLRAIFEAELPFIWRSLRRFGVEGRDLEDVAHEVFVVVHRHLGEYDATRPLKPWLFAIAFRCASDYRRRAGHRHETLGVDEVERADTAALADELVVRDEERNLARRALLTVPPERRAVVLLCDFEEVSMHDVASALGIPLKTAYSRLRVGREELIASARRIQHAQKEMR